MPYIDLNVLGIFWGIMVLSSLFIYSGAPQFFAAKLVSKTKKTYSALLAVCGLSAFISSYTENVATVLIVAPIALEVAKVLKVNPIPFIIGIAISSNLQGCATLIGDPPSIILASHAGMNFLDFFWMDGKPGIFFAVQFGTIASFFVLYLFYRKYSDETKTITAIPVKTWIPSYMIGSCVLLLVILSLFENIPHYTIGFVCVLFGIFGLLWHFLTAERNLNILVQLDWYTMFFLVGVFVLVGCLTHTGLITDFANILMKLSGTNPLKGFLYIVFISVIFSAFIDNVPFTIAMIPVAELMAKNSSVSPYPYLFGLLIGTCLGGNITPIGASCNITCMGILRKHGYKVGFYDFFRLGLPFTIAAVFSSSIFIWIVWSK